MIYEVLIKLTGGALISLIHFLPLSLHYTGDTLTVNTILTEPVTQECFNVVNQGLHLGIRYQILLIVNNAKSYKYDTTIVLTKEKDYSINKVTTPLCNIQNKMGAVVFCFANLKFKESDRVEVIIKANLLSDENFKKSTGFETSVLWKYYIPRIKTIYRYSENRFIAISGE
jgi:hypothetical protein